MKTHALVAVVVGLLLAAGAPPQDAAKGEWDRLQGRWRQIAHEVSTPLNARPNAGILNMVGGKTLEYDGNNVKVFPHYYAGLEVRGKQFTFRYAKRANEAAVSQVKTVRIDPTKKPKTIDIPGTSDKEGPLLGIYELDRDTLTICFADGKERPKDFETAPQAKDRKPRERILVRYQREK